MHTALQIFATFSVSVCVCVCVCVLLQKERYKKR